MPPQWSVQGLRRGGVPRRGKVGLRDSKNLTGPALVFTPGEGDAFTVGVPNGGFDRR
ncbi:DUF397 domain-containing protein [Nocardia sp. CA-129566]|uniref:DUF397 domain-containing protein n=1 Tax=Nocardia sp. CA-129566 TaxID=3239976 RepID=UPI003D969D0A